MLLSRHTVIRLALVFAALGMVTATVAAQKPAPQPVHAGPMSAMLMDARSARESQGEERPALARAIALDLRGVSVATALNDISARANIRLLYSSELLPKQSRVTVVNTSMSTADALAAVLSGTGLTYKSNASGVVAIVPTAEQSPAGRQATGVIVGRVLHAKTKQPVSGARVMVDDDTKGVVVGDDGSFRISVLAGEHRMTIRALGFERQVKTVTVSDNQTVTLEFVLEPSANVLNEVIVTGTVVETERKAIPNPITVITADEIEKRGVTRIDEFFRGEVPGVIALERGSDVYNGSFGYGTGGSPTYGAMERAQVYSRGASRLSESLTESNPIKTYIDGVELLDPAYLGAIDPQSIERIEIVTGPQAATIYGSGAMGGVMQIFTKKGKATDAIDFSFNLKYGMLESNVGRGKAPSHTHALNVNGGSGPALSYAGTLSYNYTGPWMPKMYSRRYGASIGATHSRDRLTAKASVSLTAGSNGTYDGAYAFTTPWEVARIQSGDWGWWVASTGVDRIASSASQTFSVSLDFRQTASFQHNLTVGMSRNVFRSADERPGLWSPADTMSRTGQMSGDRSTVNYHANAMMTAGVLSASTTIGFDAARASRLSASGCQRDAWSSAFMNCTYNSTSLQASAPLDDENYGGFGRMQLGIWERLYLTLGLRADRNPSYGRERRVNWTPSNGIAYNFSVGEASVKLLGSYGQATRAPDPDQRLAAISTSALYDPWQYVSRLENPNLTPEFSRGPQVGVELYYGSLASIVVNHYHQKITDLIQLVPVDSIERIRLSDGTVRRSVIRQYVNAATIRQLGWESQGSLNLGVLSVRGTYSWNDSRILTVHPMLSSNQQWYPGRAHFGTPTHTGSFTVSYAHAGTAVSLSTNYIGKYRRYHEIIEEYYDARNARIKTYMGSAGFGLAGNDKPAYAKSNLAVSHRVRSWLSATVNVTNVANSYESDTYLTNAVLGRQTLIGLQLRPSSRR